MPLVLMCGFPSSGKSTRATELKRYLEDVKNKKATIIGDCSAGVERNEVYQDSHRERDVRGHLKSEMQRLISKDDVLILDSPNYIKGYRYELYCVTKSSQTPHCVIHCDISQEKCSELNSQRPDEDKYNQETLNALIMRFEPPESKNRWDSPLFVLQSDDVLPCEDIYNALYTRKAPPPNFSTQTQPLSSTNYLYELDRITQDIINIIMEAQKTSVPGDKVGAPGTKEKIELIRHLTPGELQRIRRQFIAYSKTRPIDDPKTIPNMFVQYLNNSIK